MVEMVTDVATVVSVSKRVGGVELRSVGVVLFGVGINCPLEYLSSSAWKRSSWLEIVGVVFVGVKLPGVGVVGLIRCDNSEIKNEW